MNETQCPGSKIVVNRLVNVNRNSQRSLSFNFQRKEFHYKKNKTKHNSLSFPGVKKVIFLLGIMKLKVNITFL